MTSGTTVKDAELQSDIIANRVKGLLRGAFTVHDSITEDSGDLLAEVTLGVCLTSAAPQCKAHPTLAHIIYDTLQKTAPAGTFKAPANPDIGKVTGVVVDTRKLDFEPRFDARLVTSQGQEVYGPGQFDIKSGGDWLHWTRSMADATANTAVVGDHPLNVVATGTSGDSGVILDNEDAVRVFQANLQNGNFLSRGKVIFVTR